MRTYEEYQEILILWERYGNKKKIARMTGIPRATVQDCINKFGSVQGLEEYSTRNVEINGESSLVVALKNPDDPENLHQAYSYLLGMYLGDGCISKMARVYYFRLSLDKKYESIIHRCQQAIEKLLTNNKVGIVDHNTWVMVTCYYKYWPQVFPQDGDGVKHERPIILEAWQQYIVDQYPLEFFTGLYHSDGSRSQNIVKGKNYPRYFFSNVSDDIRKLFTDTTEKLSLSWTTANARNVAISRREDVVWLDEHVGPKA
jgi:hypothetical protein